MIKGLLIKTLYHMFDSWKNLGMKWWDEAFNSILINVSVLYDISQHIISKYLPYCQYWFFHTKAGCHHSSLLWLPNIKPNRPINCCCFSWDCIVPMYRTSFRQTTDINIFDRSLKKWLKSGQRCSQYWQKEGRNGGKERIFIIIVQLKWYNEITGSDGGSISLMCD